MMTNLDASNQQLSTLRERLDKARGTVAANEEKISDLQTKQEKLNLVAQKYNIDLHRLKDYAAMTRKDNVSTDKFQVDAENKLARIQEKKAQV